MDSEAYSSLSREYDEEGRNARWTREGAESALRPEILGLEWRGLGPIVVRLVSGSVGRILGGRGGHGMGVGITDWIETSYLWPDWVRVRSTEQGIALTHEVMRLALAQV
jgi:hypothetical protein